MVGQVGGAKNRYVAQRAYQEYLADLFHTADKQFPNQDYPYGLSVIDMFSKFAVVAPLKDRHAEHFTPGLFTAFNAIWQQPEVLYTDDEGALAQKVVAPEFERAGLQNIVPTSSRLSSD